MSRPAEPGPALAALCANITPGDEASRRRHREVLAALVARGAWRLTYTDMADAQALLERLWA